MSSGKTYFENLTCKKMLSQKDQISQLKFAKSFKQLMHIGHQILLTLTVKCCYHFGQVGLSWLVLTTK